MTLSSLICPNCGSIVAPDDVFCGHCGAKITTAPQGISMGRQIYIYLVSFFLPPLGLIWTFKYFRDPQKRNIGIIAAGITAVAVILTVWLTMGFFQGLQNQMNQYSNWGL